MMSKVFCFAFGILAILATFSNGQQLTYNYLDEMAQTYCQGRFVPGWVFMIRRDCNGQAPTCKDMCAAAKNDILGAIDNQRTKVECFDAMNIRKSHTKLQLNHGKSQPDAGKVSLGTYGYGKGGCDWRANHCGPNYCCCKAF